MIEKIIFKPNYFGDCKYKQTEEDNIFQPTRNTIIICPNTYVATTLSHDIVDTIKGKKEYNSYICDDKDISDINFTTQLQPFYEITAHKQTIKICLEAAMIFTTKHIKDIWFAEMTKEGISLFPLYFFKHARKNWVNNKNYLYTQIMDGRFDGQVRYKSVRI